ncbi:MAG: hypothetical protein K9G49_06520 [Taibaiella sp.]|nr:hypothetical protein [Taibaiella sp.]
MQNNGLQNNETPAEYILRMLEYGETREQIERNLVDQGHAFRFAQEIVAETVKLRYARRRTKGLAMVLVGAIVCFLSFLLTITGMFAGDEYGFVLFGLTGLGVIIVFTGLTYVF